MSAPAEVTLYTREGCHLCDEARDEILALRRSGLAIELREVDIEADERLHARFLERIPVIEVGGEVVSELGCDEPALRAAITSGNGR
ncbi:MAG TPA: glutaredoxin family protein [Solirubrobacterales bacterium]